MAVSGSDGLEKALSGAVSRVLARLKKPGRTIAVSNDDDDFVAPVPTRKRREDENEADPSNSKRRYINLHCICSGILYFITTSPLILSVLT